MRYLRLYLYFLRFSFSRAMEFRFDFFFRIVMDVVYYAVNIALFTVIFIHTELVGSWSYEQVLIFMGGVFLVDALQMTFFSNNLWMIPTHINNGNLDYYLIRPVNSLFFLTLRDFAANSFVNLLIAFGFWCWAISQYSGDWTFPGAVLYFLFLVNGTVIHAMIALIAIIPVFWSPGSRGLMSLFWSIDNFYERPDRIFKGWTHRVLVTFLPFCLIASYPARLFFEGLDVSIMGHILLVTVILFMAMVKLWSLGLKNYSSASS